MALEGWTGWHGQGKTYCAVAHVLDQWDRHKIPVWSNVDMPGAVPCDSIDVANPPPAVRFESWDELMALIEVAIEHKLRAQALIDEAGKWLSARFWNKMDPRILTVLQERRKVGAGLDLYWTAPHVQHVDRLVRDVTQVIHTSRRYGGSEYSHDGGKPPWFFLQRSYRPNDLSADQQGAKKSAKPIKRKIIPFSADLAGAYTTGLVNMRKPLDEQLDSRPDYQDGSRNDEKASTVVQLNIKRGGKK